MASLVDQDEDGSNFVGHLPTTINGRDSLQTGEDFVCAACAGSLGLFGNSVFQLAAVYLYGKIAGGLRLAVPSNYKHAHIFEHHKNWMVIDAVQAYKLPIVADRVILAHKGFLAWLRATPTYQGLARALVGSPDAVLSGRQLRKHFPQVSQEELEQAAHELTAPLESPQLLVSAHVHISNNVCTLANKLCLFDNGLANNVSADMTTATTSFATTASIPSVSSTSKKSEAQSSSALENGSSMAHTESGLRARMSGRGVWGYFQFHTSVLQPYKSELLELLRPRDHLMSAVRMALAAVKRYCCSGGVAGRLVCCHMRRGDFTDHIVSSKPSSGVEADTATACSHNGPIRHFESHCGDINTTAPAPALPARGLKTEPPFEEGQGEVGAWDAVSGTSFRTPETWYQQWLQQVGFQAEQDLLWLCTDDKDLASMPSVCGYAAWSWPSFLHFVEQSTEHVLCKEELLAMHVVKDNMMIADWLTMQFTDVLAVSNSTFSFTAAMLNQELGAKFHRPDPRIQGFNQFDPWSAAPLIPVGQVASNHSLNVRGG